MAETLTSTYKRGKAVKIDNPFLPNQKVKVRRLIACRDIPRHNVKAGDIGGFIEDSVSIRTDDAWVSSGVVILGSTCIQGNVLITDNVKINGGKTLVSDDSTRFIRLDIRDDVVISGNAILDYSTISAISMEHDSAIRDQALITGSAYLNHPFVVKDKTVIKDNASVGKLSKIQGTTTLKDHAVVGDKVDIQGNVIVSDFARVLDGATIKGSTHVSDHEVVPERATVHNGVIIIEDDSAIVFHPFSSDNVKVVSGEEQIPPVDVELPALVAKAGKKITPSNASVAKLDEIKSLIASYEEDIVKLIKFPLMTDLTDPYTAEMVFALKKAEMLAENGNPEKLAKAVMKLEQKTLVAESNARKVASSRFSEDERKKAEQARDLFSIAMNEASTENEKTIAFKSAFRKLEGIVSVPDVTIDAFRVKIGMPELEA